MTLSDRLGMLLGSHRFQLSYVLLGALLCFYPIYSGTSSNMENSSVHESLASGYFRESSFAILSLCLVFAWDFILDHFSVFFSRNSYRERAYGGDQPRIIVDSEKIVYFLGVLVVPVLVLFPASTPSLALAYTCAIHSQHILIGGFVAIMCGRYYKKYFPMPVIVFSVGAFVLTSLVNIWYINAEHYQAGGARAITYTLNIASTAPFIACIIVWIYYEFLLRLMLPRLYRLVKAAVKCWGRSGSNGSGPEDNERSSNRLEDLRRKHKENISYFPALYTMAAFFCMFYLAVAFSSSSDLYDTKPVDLLVLNIPVLVFQISMMVFSSQFAKYEAVEYLYALLESKKSYVRYISHELRTPMNTACLGLNLLLAEVGHMLENTTDEERARFETLSDISVACNTAVDILNDLLSFEKLESGILELHKEVVSPLSFVKECVGMFAVHARSKGIDLTLHCNLDEKPSLLLEADEVTMDKFKMSQVIRNLVSNALKFTPNGGTVTVRAYYGQASNEQSSQKSTGRSGYQDLTHSSRFFSSFGGSNDGKSATNVTVTGRPNPDGNRNSTKSGSVSARSNCSDFLRGGFKPGNKGKIVATDNPLVATQEKNAVPPTSVKSAGDISLVDALDSGGGGCEGQDDNDDGMAGDGCRGDIYGRLIIEIVDTGVGISRENQKKLFKQVVQFNPEVLQAGGGSGLGLWITKGIVDLHGGKISLYSAGEGCGCTFKVEIPMSRSRLKFGDNGVSAGNENGNGTVPRLNYPLPMAAGATVIDTNASANHAKTPSAPEDTPGHSVVMPNNAADSKRRDEGKEEISNLKAPREGPGPISTRIDASDGASSSRSLQMSATRPIGHPSYRLFLVDDSQLNRKMLFRVMRAQGHVCEEAEDGLMALAKVKLLVDSGGSEYDAILMDFMMPNLDGPSATRKIRDIGYKGKIFGVTGNALRSDIDTFIAAGANDVFIKPLDLNLFYEAMAGTTST